MTYKEQLLIEAEKIAKERRLEGQKMNPLWFDWDDMHNTGKQNSIKAELWNAAYVLKARADSVTQALGATFSQGCTISDYLQSHGLVPTELKAEDGDGK